jgi:hypothetical protein
MIQHQESEHRRDSRIAVALMAVLLLLSGGCRRTLSDAPDGSGQIQIDGGNDLRAEVAGDAIADVARDAIADIAGEASADADGTAIPCGDGVTCTGTDLCLTLNLCGGPLNCLDVPDGGLCPPGSTLNPSCPMVVGRPGCTPDCPGWSYRCAPRPPACGGTLSCSSCPGVCQGLSCLSASERGAFCANQ